MRAIAFEPHDTFAIDRHPPLARFVDRLDQTNAVGVWNADVDIGCNPYASR